MNNEEYIKKYLEERNKQFKQNEDEYIKNLPSVKYANEALKRIKEYNKR